MFATMTRAKRSRLRVQSCWHSSRSGRLQCRPGARGVEGAFHVYDNDQGEEVTLEGPELLGRKSFGEGHRGETSRAFEW